MSEESVSRRTLLKTAGAGIVGAAMLSTTDPAFAHGDSYEASAPDRLPATLVRPRPERGFNYPYYLYAPEAAVDDPRPIMVEPNNTGTATDDYREHLVGAGSLVRNGNGRTLSEALRLPLVVPVFPRSRTTPVDGNTYTHALDVDTLEVTTGEAARIDLQLLAMVDHARSLLDEMDYPVGDSMHMTGFSASGNFVNRFPALHPTEVEAVTAGGVNGTAVLPIAEDKGHTLNYHIGIADLESLTGEPFDLDGFADVRQYIYMGSEDTNDTIPYSDAWSETQREIALDVYGEDMQDDRMPYCESVYDDVGAAAEFKIYDGVGHRTTAEMMADLVQFHRESVDVSRVQFTTAPTAGDDSVALEATVATDGSESFDLRLFGPDGSDLTATTQTVAANETADAHVDLTRTLVADETVTAVAVPTGTTSRDGAVTESQATVIDTARVAFATRPEAGTTELTLDYSVSGEYSTGSPIHTYVTVDGEARQMVGTFPPGSSASATYGLDSGREGVPLVAGATVSVSLVDIDTSETLATAEATVASSDGLADLASVSFTEHPTYDDTDIHVEYSLDERYGVTEFAGLYLQTGENAPLLLDRIQPGESTSASYPIDKYPFEAADNAVVSVADGETLAQDEAIVLVRTSGENPSDTSTEDIVGTFTYGPATPSAGEPVTFDANGASSPNGDLLGYEWFFGGEGTRAGEAVEYTFENSGTYNVRLELVDDAGVSTAVEKRVEVSPRPASESSDANTETPRSTATAASDTATPATAETSQASSETTAGDAGPGFGVVAGLSGLAGASYLLGRDNPEEESEE